MYRVLIIVGIVAIVCVVILASVIAFLAVRGRGNDETSAKAANDIVLAIASNWSEDGFNANATPELRKVATPEEIGRLFKLYRRLGALKSLGKPEGESVAMVGFGSQSSGLTAHYLFHATFSNGPATIRVRLRENDARWQLESFRVESKVFLP